MRIGIDARTILSPEKGDAIGVGHYTYQLLRHLLEIDQENEYVIFFDFRVREKDVKKFSKSNVKIKFYPFSDYKRYLPGVYNELLGNATLQKEKLDVLHSTSPTSRIPASYKGKTVVTFHDMAMFQVPQYLPRVSRLKSKAVSKYMAKKKKADKIIAVSQSLKGEVEHYLEVPDEKIQVIYSGIDKRFFDKPNDEKKIIERFGISKKYILFLGTLEPSKNVARLLEAFARLKKNHKNKGQKFDYQLVLAGKRGWLSEEYGQMVKDLGLEKDIVFTGYIIGDELVPLFRNAEFFIMPSLYEGFGMTALEAFATEVPAVLARVSSLPEIAGEAAHFVNPLSSDEIMNAMQSMLDNPQLRDEYRKKGSEQVKKFDWHATARQTLELYRKLV